MRGQVTIPFCWSRRQKNNDLRRVKPERRGRAAYMGGDQSQMCEQENMHLRTRVQELKRENLRLRSDAAAMSRICDTRIREEIHRAHRAETDASRAHAERQSCERRREEDAKRLRRAVSDAQFSLQQQQRLQQRLIRPREEAHKLPE